MSRTKELNKNDKYKCKWCEETFRYALSLSRHELYCKAKYFEELNEN